MRRRPSPLLALLACGIVGVSGCSVASSGTTGGEERTTVGRTTYPITVDNCGHRETFASRPQRVAILNGASVGEAESFVALGLSDTVAGNAQYYGVSDDPTMVARVDALPKGGLSSNQNVDVSAEQLIALRPDLVVSTWSGGFDAASGFATRAELDRLGIRTLVNPLNCANGKPDATAAEERTFEHAGVTASFDLLRLLGTVFGVQDRAEAVIAAQQARLDATAAAVAGKGRPVAVIAYPRLPNPNGAPGILTGGLVDDVLARAGTVNAFAGLPPTAAASLSLEQVATADVDVLVLGAFTPNEDREAEANELFARYPQWPASRARRYVAVSDGVYLGPLNGSTIAKIAQVAHPTAASGPTQ